MRLLALVCLLSLSAASSSAAQQQRPDNVTTTTDYLAPPTNLQALYVESTAVVECHVVASIQRSLPGQPYAMPIVQHDIRINRVFKSDGSLHAGDTIKVSQPGGTVVSQGTTIVESTGRHRVLKANEHLILFLGTFPAAGTYLVKYGADGAFAVDDTTDLVTLPDGAKKMKEFAGADKVKHTDLAQLLESMAGK